MKILMLYPGLFDKGGISRYGRYQVRALRQAFGEQNVETFVLMGRANEDFETSFDVTWHGVTPVTTRLRVEFAIRAMSRALRLRPAVVLTGHVNLGPLGSLIAAATGARLIQNIYGREIWSGLSRLRAAALRHADYVISDCHYTAGVAQQRGITSRKASVIWDCVDIARFHPGAARWDVLEQYGLRNEGQFNILFLGRIAHDSKYKGFERLVELVDMIPSTNVRAVIAGGGDYVTALRALVTSKGLERRVTITGRVSEDHLVDLYRSAHAFYLASNVGHGLGEGLPLTPIEAMACGVPAIVGNADGSQEIIENGGGICLAPDDLEGARFYIESLIQNDEFREKERRTAQSRIELAFGFDGFADATVSAVKAAADSETSG